MRFSYGKIGPEVSVIRTEQRSLFTTEDKKMMPVDVTKARHMLGLQELVSPRKK